MQTAPLKKFAQAARRQLQEAVTARLDKLLFADSIARRENPKVVTELERRIKQTSKEAVIERTAYIWFNRFCALRFMDVNHYTKLGIVSPLEGFTQPELLAEAKQGHMDSDEWVVESEQWVVGSDEWVVDSNNGPAETVHLPLSTDHLRITSPEEIRICDPACGSGHMLVYAFELLYAIYEEEGYDANEIPGLILTKNLYGIEIDERAGELAAFALTMKARDKYKRFFSKPVQPSICVLENISFTDDTVGNYVNAFGEEIFSPDVVATLQQFGEANNFGSLITPKANDLIKVLEALQFLKERSNANIGSAEELSQEQHVLVKAQNFTKIVSVLQQADYLSPKYHVVIANPPYMGGKGMNGRLAAWAKNNYLNSKSDLFAMFIERNLCLAKLEGAVAMITMQTWMFLSSYEKMRAGILGQSTFLSMAHLGARAFDSIGGEVVSTTAFVLEKANRSKYKGIYLRLVDANSEAEKEVAIHQAIKNPDCGWFYYASSSDFKKIPSSPFAYWVSDIVRHAFTHGIPFAKIAKPKLGMRTGNNDKFIRLWAEVNYKKVGFGFRNAQEAKDSGLKWFPYNKGGEFRRWYGNNEYIVNWENDGYEIKVETLKNYPQLSWENLGWKISNEKDFFKPSLEWSRISSEYLGVRFSQGGFLFDTNGSSAFPQHIHLKFLIAFLCTKISANFAKILNPSLAFQPGDLSIIPIIGIPELIDSIDAICAKLIKSSKSDWDSYETSWDFIDLPLLQSDNRQRSLKVTYQNLCALWGDMTFEMQHLEKENNRIFIKAYGLQDELTPEVPLKEITLTCNPHYRYGGDKTEEELEKLLLADTMKEFISYAVGCMFGRYSLDKPGLILANQGETVADYIRKVCSEKCIVSRKGESNGSKKLQGTDCLAKGDGFGGTGLSGSEAISQGGTLRIDQSDQAGSGVHPFQHCRGAGTKIDSGVSEFLVHCERFKSRDGNPNPACPALELCNERNNRENTQPVGGGGPNTLRADKQPEKINTNPSPLSAAHSPLSTSHYLLSTDDCPLSTLHFLPDDDNVIPMLGGEWFTDDITERFFKFLRVTFGEEHYDENLRYLEEAIGKDVRKYFLKDFYPDHIKRYKKRPIYWLFSSPKGSFNALIYLHRYQPDTVSVVLNDYLREFRIKLNAHISHQKQVSISDSATPAQKVRAVKEMEKLKTIVDELNDYERDTLYPLATQKIEIDLDDGVKVNYPKFGKALKKVAGLSGKEK